MATICRLWRRRVFCAPDAWQGSGLEMERGKGCCAGDERPGEPGNREGPGKCQLCCLSQALAAAALAGLLFLMSGFARSAPLTIITAEEPPTNFTQNGEPAGIVVDIVKAILSSLHQKTEIKIYPWARAYKMAVSQPNVVIFTAAKTQERMDLGFSFVGPVTTRRHILYKEAGRALAVSNIEDVKRLHLRVGAMRGDWRGKFLSDRGVDVEEVETHPQNVKKLLSGRIDLFVLSDLELMDNVRIAGAEPRQIEPAYLLLERDAYILLSRGTSPETVAQWQEAFAGLRKTDFFKRTAHKWGASIGVPLGYSSDKGFHIQ